MEPRFWTHLRPKLRFCHGSLDITWLLPLRDTSWHYNNKIQFWTCDLWNYLRDSAGRHKCPSLWPVTISFGHSSMHPIPLYSSQWHDQQPHGFWKRFKYAWCCMQVTHCTTACHSWSRWWTVNNHDIICIIKWTRPYIPYTSSCDWKLHDM